MDIERLTARNKNGLAYLVKVKPNEQEVDSPYKNTLKCILDCFERLAQYEEAEIAHQSATSAEVAEAILLVEELAEIHAPEWRNEESSMKVGDDCSINECLMTLAITALQAYQPWIPVSERLPESGKHVLLCCEVRPSGKRYVCDGYYANSKSITSGYSDECSNEYDEETDEYYLTEGYYEIIKNWGDYSSIAIDGFVTHWKPLPEPPKGE